MPDFINKECISIVRKYRLKSELEVLFGFSKQWGTIFWIAFCSLFIDSYWLLLNDGLSTIIIVGIFFCLLRKFISRFIYFLNISVFNTANLSYSLCLNQLYLILRLVLLPLNKLSLGVLTLQNGVLYWNLIFFICLFDISLVRLFI